MNRCGLRTEQPAAAAPAQDRVQPIRVTLVTHYYPAHRGGVERIAGQLAERLTRSGIAQIAWHASDCDAAPAIPGLQYAPAPAWNALERSVGFPYPLWSARALRRLGSAAAGAEVVHLHDCLYLPNLVAFIAARLAGRPVLVTQHVAFVPYRNPLLRGVLSVANRLVGGFVLRRATRVVFESATVQRYFARFVRFRSPPLLVPNGVDTTAFSPVDPAQREMLRARYGGLPDTPLFLFIGRFVEKKGIDVLRVLAERFPQVRWVLAGWGPLDPQAWGLPNVSVVRSPTIDELAPLYRAADLFVLPSAGEGFPLAVQEAMASGTPALIGAETAAGCPIADAPILSEATAVEDTATRWTARIEALLRDPQRLHEMRPRVAAFAREHWSWEACVARYAVILHSCLERA